MLHKGNYRGGKHNPKTQDAHEVHKSSAGQRSGRRPQPFNTARSAPYYKQEETKGTQYGRCPQPFSATKFAGKFEQAEAKGNTGLWNAVMSSRPEGEPETFDMDDIDMEAAREPDETSNTADLGTNSVEPRENKLVELKPFNFLDHPDNVRQQILRCMLVSDEPIKPFWNLGALEVAAKESSKENFTTILVAFAGNKELLDEATTILYGENSFKLQHAKVSLWWLKRIGSNISKIKTLTILLEEGVMDQFGTRFETLWYEIIHMLKVQHRLQYLKLSFVNWANRIDNRDGLDPAKIVYILEPRYALIRTLLSFRGLGKAVIKPGEFVNKYCAGLLEAALVLGPGQTTQGLIEMEEAVAEPKKTKYLFT